MKCCFITETQSVEVRFRPLQCGKDGLDQEEWKLDESPTAVNGLVRNLMPAFISEYEVLFYCRLRSDMTCQLRGLCICDRNLTSAVSTEFAIHLPRSMIPHLFVVSGVFPLPLFPPLCFPGSAVPVLCWRVAVHIRPPPPPPHCFSASLSSSRWIWKTEVTDRRIHVFSVFNLSMKNRSESGRGYVCHMSGNVKRVV